jgi:hypothetical protein
MAINLGDRQKFLDALVRAGAIGPNDPNRITRIVIDIKANDPLVAMKVEYLPGNSVYSALTEAVDKIERG